MAKNTFFSSFQNAKNANFDRLTWTMNCDVIIEHIRNLTVSSDSSLNSVSDRVLEHVPKVKTDQNMLIFSTTKQCVSIRKFRAFFHFRTIWHILALVNKFSLNHYMAEPDNGGAQVLRLWDFGDLWSQGSMLPPECSAINKIVAKCCLLSSPAEEKAMKSSAN